MPNLATTGDSCFRGCSSLSIVNLNLETVGPYCFVDCTGLTEIYLPHATSLGPNVFEADGGLSTIFLPMCTNLGGSTGNDNVFMSMSNPWAPPPPPGLEPEVPTYRYRTLTVPLALNICNDGDPDGDIISLKNQTGNSYFTAVYT